MLVSLPPVIFVALQTDAAANGGITSLGQIIAGLKHHRAIVVTDRETPQIKEWRRAGVEVHLLEQTVSSGFVRNPLQGLRSYWKYFRLIRRLVASSGARVIHANSPLALQLATAAAKLTGAKVVLNLRGTFDPDRRLSQRRFRAVFRAAEHVLFLSNDQARRWSGRIPNAVPSHSVTYSVVDPKEYRPSPIPKSDKPIVLICGLIRPLKGQLEFIRHVVPALHEKGVETWLAGDFDERMSSYKADCLKAAEPYGDSIRFLGFRDDVPELMAKARVVTISSRHEGLVRAMIEATSCGRPVVSFDVCSAREILEEQSGGAGTVVKAGDYNGMANAVLSYCLDYRHAAEAGRKGAAVASRLFDADLVVSRYERVYDLVASGKSSEKLVSVAGS